MQEMALQNKNSRLGTGVSELHLMQSKANSLTQTKLPTWRQLLANVQILHPLFYICCFKQSPNHSKSDVYILSLTKTQIIPNQIPPLEIPKGQIEITWNHLEIRPFCPCNASVVKQDAQVPTHQAITGFVMRPFFLAWQYRTWCAFWDHVSHVRVQNWSKFSEIQISILRVKPLTIDG